VCVAWQRPMRGSTDEVIELAVRDISGHVGSTCGPCHVIVPATHARPGLKCDGVAVDLSQNNERQIHLGMARGHAELMSGGCGWGCHLPLHDVPG